MPTKALLEYFRDSVFDAAEKFLELKNIDNVKFVFVGQGMRPFFEAVRALNEIKEVLPRHRIRYFISPDIINASSKRPHLYKIVKEKLARLGIASKKWKKYCVVDFRAQGKTFSLIHDVLQEINPNATVIEIDQNSEAFGKTIKFSDRFNRPVKKDLLGNITGEMAIGGTEQFLFFQIALQEWINEIKAKEKFKQRALQKK